MVVGLIWCLMRVSSYRWMQEISSFFVEILRGIPMLVLLYYISFVGAPALILMLNWLGRPLIEAGIIAELNVRQVDFTARAVLALSLGYSAFISEIFRAGIELIGKEQTEAAQTEGATYWQTMRFILLPQAVRNVLPALGNEFIAMLKDLALVRCWACRISPSSARFIRHRRSILRDVLDRGAAVPGDDAGPGDARALGGAEHLIEVGLRQQEYTNASEKNLVRAALLNKVTQALAKQQIAQARLEQAQKDNDELQQGPDPDKLALADKRIETAQGRIAAADTARAAAQETLADLKHLQVHHTRPSTWMQSLKGCSPG